MAAKKRCAPLRARSELRFRSTRRLLLLGVLTVISVGAQAQGLGRVDETTSNVPSYFFFVEPGAATVQVDVLGAVRAPGLYELTDGTDVGQLLALTGGPLLAPQQRASVRRVTIRLFRSSAGSAEPVYEQDLDEALKNIGTYPVLQDGDVLTVEVIERTRITWRDISSIVGTIGVLALAAERILLN